MFLKRLTFLLLASMMAGCVAPIGSSIKLDTIGEYPSNAEGLSWADVMDGLTQHGFDVDGATSYGKGCWIASAPIFGMETTLIVDKKGNVFEEFAPNSCRGSSTTASSG